MARNICQFMKLRLCITYMISSLEEYFINTFSFFACVMLCLGCLLFLEVHSDSQQQHQQQQQQQQQSQEIQQQNHQTNNLSPEPDKNVPANSDKTVELTKTTTPSSGDSEKPPETNPTDRTETVHDTGVDSPSLESQFFESFEESIGARILPPGKWPGVLDYFNDDQNELNWFVCLDNVKSRYLENPGSM